MKLSQYHAFQVVNVNGYKCYQLPVNPQTQELASYLRDLHKERLYHAGYEGYSDEVDDSYHRNGTYFFVEINNVIATTLRANKRTNANPFPFEMGFTENGCQHKFEAKTHAIDLNTYCLDKRYYKNATPLLFALAAHYIKNQHIKRAFGLYDVGNGAIKHIYGKLGFTDSVDYPEPIHFSDFIYRESQKPVNWGVIEWNAADIAQHNQTFLKIIHEHA